ncbi:MAG: hypothetical protein ACI308_01705 [Muribaculaceae bacterium]
MGFFNKIKNALGYPEGDYDDEDELDGFNPSHRTPYVNPFKKEDTVPDLSDLEESKPQSQLTVPDKPKAVAEFEDKLPEGVFDGIITIINGSLPEFLRECIDLDKERKAVSIAMGPKFSDYVRNLRRTSLEEARNQWIDERNDFTQRLAQADLRANDAVRKATEIKDRLMSEERQRRAIVERSHDLEARISELEAQREQDQLQNKGLLNKIKVLQVQVGDSQKDAEEISRLNQLINEQRQKIATIAQLDAQITELTHENDDLKAQLESLNSKNDNEELLQEFKTKMELANALITELRVAANEKEKEAAQASEKLRIANDELANTQMELKEAREELEIAAEIQDKIEQFEKIKAKKDAEIKSLREQVVDAMQSSNALVAANEALQQSRSEVSKGLARIAELEELVAQLKDVNLQHDVDLANKVDSLLAKLKEADKKLATQAAEYDQLKGANSEQGQSISRLEAENLSLRVQVKNLKANINDRDAEINELRKQVPVQPEAENEPLAGDDSLHVAPNDEMTTSIDEIDDIDWLMPSPPSEPEPEPKPEPVKEERQKPNPEIGSSQMSLF